MNDSRLQPRSIQRSRPGRFNRVPISGREDRLVDDAVVQAKAGDPEALHFLYARYADEVFVSVRRLVGDHHEAEDITQTVFAKLIKAIRTYEPRDVPLSAWILRVARNAALDHLRARRAIPCEDVRGVDEDCGHIAVDRRRSLHEALDRLTDQQREVVILRHIAGLSPGEIADVLHKTEGAVDGLHHRGRESLQAALRELGAAPVTAAVG